jgi:hypothetical protein
MKRWKGGTVELHGLLRNAKAGKSNQCVLFHDNGYVGKCLFIS